MRVRGRGKREKLKTAAAERNASDELRLETMRGGALPIEYCDSGELSVNRTLLLYSSIVALFYGRCCRVWW